MKVDGRPYRSLWLDRDGRTVRIIDQRWLPHELWTVGLTTLDEALDAIRDGRVRGGPLVAAVCAYGIAFAMLEAPSNTSLLNASGRLARHGAASAETGWALREMNKALLFRKTWERRAVAYARANELCEEGVRNHRLIGVHGLNILRVAATRKGGRRLNVLVPSSAGWLSAVDWGTALAPIYSGREAGLRLHVLLDAVGQEWTSTALIRWELAGQGVPHTTINAVSGNELMRDGLVDLVLLGAQSVTWQGEVRNAEPLSRWAMLAHEHAVPCYAAASSAAIGWGALGDFTDGLPQLTDIAPDLTLSKYLRGIITERGLCLASHEGLEALFPERVAAA
jgi:methylthioribose-1-phosphate isomerase